VNGGETQPPFTSETAKAAGIKSGYVRRARAEARKRAVAEGRAEMLEPTPSRAEIAELAKSAMPAALERLEKLIHTSRSDSAIVAAFTALKEAAYGKDTLPVGVKVTYDSMSEDEIRALLAQEMGPIIEHQPDSDTALARITEAESEGES
jgi:hypothetical protein